MTKNEASSTSATRAAFGIAITALVLLTLDQGGAWLLDRVIERSTWSPLVKVERSKAETLVLGSSTAKYAVDAAHFLPNSLNAGENGQGVFYTAAILSALPNAGSLKRVVALIDPGGLSSGFNNNNLKHLWRYAPLARRAPQLRPWLRATDPWASVKLLSGLFAYRDDGRRVVKYWLRPETEFYPYEPLVGRKHAIDASQKSLDGVSLPTSKEGLALLDRMAADVTRLGVKLVVAVTPVPGLLREEHAQFAAVFIDIRSRLAKTDFCDLTLNPPDSVRVFSLDADNFWDGPHLNQRGARAYSAMLAERIINEC